MSYVAKYEGTTDPHECILAHTTNIKGNDPTSNETKKIWIKKFGEMSIVEALTWYSHLVEHSINSVDACRSVYKGTRKDSKSTDPNGEYLQNRAR